jgi:hypothetical protein
VQGGKISTIHLHGIVCLLLLWVLSVLLLLLVWRQQLHLPLVVGGSHICC